LNKPKALPKSKIIVHCLVKNEERFIWYALQSVLPYVDHVLVWDTGSTDKTLDIIRSIKSPKISLKTFKSVSATTHTKLRQQMLQATPKDKYDWLMILDGDEVWPEASIKKTTQFARTHPDYESIIVRTHNLVGDIYHRLPESAGHYRLAGHTGHLSIRFMNLKKIPGLNVNRPHGQQGFFDGDGNLIQNRDPKKQKFFDLYYHHATHLQRSSTTQHDHQVIKRSFKKKTEIGSRIPDNQIPKVFFQDHPDIVPDVTKFAPLSFWLLALLITPVKYLKRLLVKSPSGY